MVFRLRKGQSGIRARDPLRYFLAWWAISVNPAGKWLLGPELRRWILGREAHCDRGAVLCGASAPALAQALVRAARFSAACVNPSLHAAAARVLRLRGELLLAYTDRRPERWIPVPDLRATLALLVLALVVLHHWDAGALDTLHRATGRAAALVTGE